LYFKPTVGGGPGPRGAGGGGGGGGGENLTRGNIYIIGYYGITLVDVATRYGLDCPGIESRWRVRFSAPVQNVPGVHPASCTVDTGSFPGEKRSERGVDHPPPSSAEVIERVELYLFSPSGPPWPVLW